MSCVHGGREWGANAEIELQDCGCPQSRFSHGRQDRSGLTHIEELASLRNGAIEKLAEKVAARHAEPEAEIGRFSQYGKSAKKSQAAAPAAKPKKRDEKKNDSAKNDMARTTRPATR